MATELNSSKLTINVGSRKSQLALIQTKTVIDKLKSFYSNNHDELMKLFNQYCKTEIAELDYEVISLCTFGDKVLDKPLPKIGTKSLFTRELEIELLQGRVRFIVHSLKDLPTTLPEGCVIGAILKRDSPYDAIVLKNSLTNKVNPIEMLTGQRVLNGLNKIGTSSQRRIAMLKRCNPNLECIDIRGNLNTRLSKLDNEDSDYAAIILAEAGLVRMDWSSRVSAVLNLGSDKRLIDWYYAVGQGAIAVECRKDDEFLLKLLSPISDMRTTYEAVAERALMKKLEGGCSVPLGVVSGWAGTEDAPVLCLKSIVLSVDGKECIKAEGSVTLHSSEAVIHSDSETDIDINYTTGVLISKSNSYELNARNIVKCSELGVDVASKLISLGCLALMQTSSTSH